jgi:hypothetical protein
MDGSQLLAEVEGLADKVRGRERVDDQTVYQGIVESAANGQLTGVAKEAVVALAEAIERTVTQRAIVDWQDDPDVQNRMKTDIEDAIFEWQKAHGVDLGFDAIDRILDQSVDTARARSRR